jgi:hypothetical protein
VTTNTTTEEQNVNAQTTKTEARFDRDEVTMKAYGVGTSWYVVSQFSAEPAGIVAHAVFVESGGSGYLHEGTWPEWADAARYVVEHIEAEVKAEPMVLEGSVYRCEVHR